MQIVLDYELNLLVEFDKSNRTSISIYFSLFNTSDPIQSAELTV